MFFVEYFFYFDNGSPEKDKMIQWLIKNGIEYKFNNDSVIVDFTRYYFNYLIIKDDGNIDVEDWFSIQKYAKKYNMWLRNLNYKGLKIYKKMLKKLESLTDDEINLILAEQEGKKFNL